jgi:hypothetical protein
MKHISLLLYSLFCTLVISVSCKKPVAVKPAVDPAEPQKTQPVSDSVEPQTIKFVLFTSKDFSNYNGNITFTLSVRRNGTRQAIWDSILPPMRVSEIPGPSNKIIIEKTFPANAGAISRAGFIYSLEHVGISWYWNYLAGGETFKTVEYDFQ